jgi:hypothetical protein
VSHDIHTDPEFWELRELYTDRAGFVWLEMLSIADRNDGVVGPDSVQTVAMLASRCRTSRAKVASVLTHGCAKGWLIRNQSLAIAKWSKYHRTEERKLVPTRPDPTEPDLIKSPKKDSFVNKPDMSVEEFVESWNEWFDGVLPKVEWPLVESRKLKIQSRLKEHKNLDFWKQVFANINASSFLLGRNNGTWRCTLDWLTANDRNCLKVYEGSYANGKTEQRYHQQRG